MLKRAFSPLDARKYKIVILGGGSGGISVAAQLAKHPLLQGSKDLLIVEPSATHYYQPFWTLVGAGLKTLQSSAHPTQSLIPQGADWLTDSVTLVDPKSKVIITKSGAQVNYDYLVVATGIKLDWDSVPGLKETLGKNGVSSNYDVNSVQQTAINLAEFKGGKAVFTQPSTPIKCAGAPQKIAYLAEEIFRKHGIREKCHVDFYSGAPKIFAIDKYAEQLTKICQSRDINVHLNHNLVKILPKKQAVFKNVQTNDSHVVDYDLLHVTPPMCPPPFIKESGLADAAGWVNVDKETTQHLEYPNIFSLGDASSLPTSKTAAAVAAQSGVVSANLISAIQGRPLTEKYDGYTSCPLVTGENKLILAEFSGYTGKPQETFFYDQSKENSFNYMLKTKVFPNLYWKLMMKGLWSGPASVRPILNPLKN